MKIIFSRKGFDSDAGGIASPILPNGDMLSLPIPSEEKYTHHKYYTELFYGDKNYAEIVSELKYPRKSDLSQKRCHLDPDMRSNNKNKDWVSAFGQADRAQVYLRDNGIKGNDLFLFFGWFKKTIQDETGKLWFIENSDIHAIFGYLQIAQVLTKQNEIDNYPWHPHANVDWKNNCLYVAKSNLSLKGLTHLPGYGLFKYNDSRRLTKKHSLKSEWELPSCLNGLTHNTGHRQEKIVECNDEIENWITKIMQ